MLAVQGEGAAWPHAIFKLWSSNSHLAVSWMPLQRLVVRNQLASSVSIVAGAGLPAQILVALVDRASCQLCCQSGLLEVLQKQS